MSKKPAATLSASLVAVKGAAVPAPDMPGRGSPTAPVSTPLVEEQRVPPRPAAREGGEGTLTPLNRT